MDCPYCKDTHALRLVCFDCGKILDAKDRHYLGGRCSPCETLWHDAVVRWCRGEHNPELDARFTYREPEPTVN